MINDIIRELRHDPKYNSVTPSLLADLIKDIFMRSHKIRAVKIIQPAPDGYWYSNLKGGGLHVIDDGKEWLRVIGHPRQLINRSHVQLIMPGKMPKIIEKTIEN